MYRPAHQASGQSLRKLLRSGRLLACEVAAARVGLGNLATTCGENRADSIAEGMTRPAVSDHGARAPINRPRQSQERLGGEVLPALYKETLTEIPALLGPETRKVVGASRTRNVWQEDLRAQQTGEALAIARGKRALRHFLHAIHACPTASAAWLNASEVPVHGLHGMPVRVGSHIARPGTI